MDSVSELKLMSLISKLLPLHDIVDPEWESKITPLIIQIISLVRSMDLDFQPKPESKLMSFVTQTISLFNSMDLDSLPKPLSKLISLISQKIFTDSDQKPESDLDLKSLVEETLQLKPEPELVSLIRQIVWAVVSMKLEWKKLICLSPQVKVHFRDRKCHVIGEVGWESVGMWHCFLGKGDIFSFTGSEEDFTGREEDVIHFHCRSCNGEYHKEYEMAPLEIKHPLHQKHSLQLALNVTTKTRECYCCDEDLMKVFYYCSGCDFAMNIACVEKPRNSYILPKHAFLSLRSKNLSLAANSADSDSESKLISLISQLLPLHNNRHPEWASKVITLIIQIISLVRSMDLDSQPKPESESKLMSLVTQTISFFNSMDFDSLPKPLSELISLICRKVSTDSDQKPESDLNFKSLVEETLQLKPDHELVSLIRQIVSLVISVNSEFKKLISLCPQISGEFNEGKFNTGNFVCRWASVDCFVGYWDIFRLTGSEDATHFFCRGCKGEYHGEYEKAPLEIKHHLHQKHSLQLTWNAGYGTRECYCCDEDLIEVFYCCSACDFAINIACVEKPPNLSILSRRDLLTLHSKNLSLSANTVDSDFESKLTSLISQLLPLHDRTEPEWESKIITQIIQIISLVRSVDMDLQPKPESKLMSLVTQTISVFNAMDLDSLPKPLWKIILLISQNSSTDSDQKKPESDLKLASLVDQTLKPIQDHELVSLIRQILAVVIYMNPKLKNLIFLCPQAHGYLREGKFCVVSTTQEISGDKWSCFIGNWEKFKLTGREDATHLRCRSCNGVYHGEYKMEPHRIIHPLHRKHSLQLVSYWESKTRNCYCCDEDLIEVFYHCKICDCSMNIACVEKPPVEHIDCSKWHEHTLALFPRRASLTCNLCALDDSSSPIYMCPPCEFVVHLRCINLPRVIRISRHPHRIWFTPSFEGWGLSCRICRRKIDNDYGGYSCIKDGCFYAAHSRCATQSNVWDGIDLEGEPEEIEETAEPFLEISDGIIQHFSHDHHHLRLDENTCGDYDENRQCQACMLPIYSGNFYSCVQCEFVLHGTCKDLSRKLDHPIHPHPLTLALVRGNAMDREHRCSTCNGPITAGFFYECGKEGCKFQVHVHCATISEPLLRGIHKHHLYLTSKPEERRGCGVCRKSNDMITNETFNCIKCDDFSLCFKCATIPQKVRYKHDKHVLTLSYGEETSTTAYYWCEACERKINPKEGFYICDEYCSVTLHIECLTGKDLYMKPGSSFLINDTQVRVLPNNHHMSRPICSNCEKRCPHKIVFESDRLIFCSLTCRHDFFLDLTSVFNAIA